MKRIDMIELLANDIDCIRKTQEHEASNKTLAEILLNHLEEAGMLPPEYNLNEGSGMFGIPSYYRNEWE